MQAMQAVALALIGLASVAAHAAGRGAKPLTDLRPTPVPLSAGGDQVREAVDAVGSKGSLSVRRAPTGGR